MIEGNKEPSAITDVCQCPICKAYGRISVLESQIKDANALASQVAELLRQNAGLEADNARLENECNAYRMKEGCGEIAAYYLLAEELCVPPGGSVVETVHAKIAELKDANSDLLAMGDTFSIPSIIEQLCIATDHLLNQHDCDCHGHEGRLYAAQAGWRWLHKHGYTETPELPRVPMSELPRRYYETMISKLESENKRMRELFPTIWNAAIMAGMEIARHENDRKYIRKAPDFAEVMKANGLGE